MKLLLKKLFAKHKSDSLSMRFVRNKRAEDGHETFFTSFQKFTIWLFEDEPYSWGKTTTTPRINIERK